LALGDRQDRPWRRRVHAAIAHGRAGNRVLWRLDVGGGAGLARARRVHRRARSHVRVGVVSRDLAPGALRRQTPLRARVMTNRLRDLRAARGWSQAELGMRVGVSRQAIIAIETGRFDPSLPLAFKLARLFGLRIEDIFESDGK